MTLLETRRDEVEHRTPRRASRTLPPQADAISTPSASDEYFVHAAGALGLDIRFLHIDVVDPPTMFHNYSKYPDATVGAIADEAWNVLFGAAGDEGGAA